MKLDMPWSASHARAGDVGECRAETPGRENGGAAGPEARRGAGTAAPVISLLGRALERAQLVHRGQLAERLDLQLAHPLAREADLATDLGQRALGLVVQAVAHLDDAALALRQRGEAVHELAPARLDVDRQLRILRG